MEKLSKIENMQNTIKASLKSISMNFEAENGVNENEYDEVVTFDTNAVKNKQKVTTGNYNYSANLIKMIKAFLLKSLKLRNI